MKTVIGNPECTYRKAETGKQRCIIVSTQALSNKQGYTGALEAIIAIPEAE